MCRSFFSFRLIDLLFVLFRSGGVEGPRLAPDPHDWHLGKMVPRLRTNILVFVEVASQPEAARSTEVTRSFGNVTHQTRRGQLV